MIDSQTAYLIFYIITGLYLIALGFWMFFQKDNPTYSSGEQKAKQRVTRSVGTLMFVGAFGWFIYLPPMLYTTDYSLPIFKICFLTGTMLLTTMFYVVMRAVLQKWKNTLRGAAILFVQFLIIELWFIIDGENDMFPSHVAGVLSMVYVVYFLIWYSKEYHNYVRRLRLEYSDISSRDIFWSWWCFSGLAIQIVVFVVEQFFWSFTFEIVYIIMSIVNAGYICFSSSRYKPLDIDIVPEITVDAHEEMPNDDVHEVQSEEKAFYGIIEQKLEALCEKKQLYLEPDLTRETLCSRLSIGRTYLSLYLSSRGLSFYKYINTLRVEYAVSLMRENPEMPVREVCRLSGFRSQTTFRKVFQDVLGCKPSEMRKRDAEEEKSEAKEE